jgi:hypothetical protein
MAVVARKESAFVSSVCSVADQVEVFLARHRATLEDGELLRLESKGLSK